MEDFSTREIYSAAAGSLKLGRMRRDTRNISSWEFRQLIDLVTKLPRLALQILSQAPVAFLIDPVWRLGGKFGQAEDFVFEDLQAAGM